MGDDPTGIERLILEAATGPRQPALTDLRRVLVHVAQAGFDLKARERARSGIAGLVWQGRAPQSTDLLPPAERHYLWHVVRGQEWPVGTTLDDYLASIRHVVLDPTSGVFSNRYQGAWSLAIARESRQLRGPNGADWILVQYRVALGHWTTVFQPRRSIDDELRTAYWSDIRWLQRPRFTDKPI